ncbi:MAG: hypothetical protein K2K08_09270 [Paramuribaculum sp.]|nr:hypothetical protein [Paramuribaculum sp.]
MGYSVWQEDNLRYETVLYDGAVPYQPEYRITITAKGYENLDIDVSTTENGYINFGTVMLLRKQREIELNEVTVTATRIKMVMKGDTIEYDAAAFRLQDGSMLDGLISMLPGATLDNNGRISVNGRFVSELLVNGRKFFSGDPQVALRNLPAYTVKKIQVYQKTPEELRGIKNRDRSDDPLVMDVGLKKEYMNGWIANAEGGYGSGTSGRWSTRWMGRLFGMRYTKKSSIAIHSSANNLNDPEASGTKGQWRKPNSTSGEITTKRVGIEYNSDWYDQTEAGINTKFNLVRQSTFNTIETLNEAYLTGGNTFSRSKSALNRSTWRGDWAGGISRRFKTFVRYISIAADLKYENGKLYSESASAESDSMLPDNFVAVGSTDFVKNMLYLRQQSSLLKDRSLGQNYNAAMSFVKGLRFGATATLNNTTSHTDGSDRITYPSNSELNINRLRRSNIPSREFSYKLNPSWNGYGSNWRAGVKYTYSQKYNYGERTMEEIDQAEENTAPSMQPSWAIDYANSYRTTRRAWSNTINTDITYWWGGEKKRDYYLTLFGNIENISRHVSDFRNQEPHNLSRNDWRFEGSLKLNKGGNSGFLGGNLALEMTLDQTLPDVMQLLDVRDTSNPLVLELGNPNLHKATKYGATVLYDKSFKKPSAWLTLSFNYHRIDNALARARTFDRTTGVTTWYPDNINGNWVMNAKIYYSIALLPGKALIITNTLLPTYACSADYSSDSDKPVRSEVDNWNIRNDLAASYEIMRGLMITSKINLAWTSLHSRSNLFNTFDYADVNYGIGVKYTLPGGVNLDTDLMAYCRRGYEDISMNTTDWVWNLQLSKSFGKTKQFTAKAIGFDLLHQLPTIKQVVNPQGRTETRYNSQPAYAILTIAYRLDIKPRTK